MTLRSAGRIARIVSVFSLASLHSRLAFFSVSDSTPRTLPFSSSQGSVRKKQRAEDLSGRWQASSRCLNTHVPRRHRRGRESRYRWTTSQAASIVSLNAPLSAGRRGKCVHDPHRLTLTPRFPTTVIGGQNKTHTFSNIFLPTISILLLCSQSAQPFQPLATRARGLAGHSRCVNMSNDYGKTRLYTPIRSKTTALCERGRSSPLSENAQVLCAKVMNLLGKGAI